ncbi:hypothetical protein O1611_g6814 [Lasiodiplodia mahajangana]|uniref:Uncharacterized protein n=1 Tax=Lasiodiplodia mahajangana TaxID=1108764 RepID=A0ACC2JHH2_9PEZI|nr:hypothetical protein O1611_g6814 [Lasiodiplodia mahajangana]
MSDKEPKAFTWRVSSIPKGVTKNELLEFFIPEDRARATICSLYPSAEDDDQLTATVLFRPHPDRPDIGPKTAYGSPELEIDKDFEGFTTLHSPADETTIVADIIAVTGLAGHAFGSWASSDKVMWLRDYVPDFAPKARVLTYGYDSRITGPDTSISKLSDLSQTFVQMLIDMRDKDTREQRPIIFIGHSLGCMIIKKVLHTSCIFIFSPVFNLTIDLGNDKYIDVSQNVRNCYSYEDPANRVLTKSLPSDSSRLPVRAIIFLAAPHRGMDIKALQNVVRNTPPEHLVAELAPESETLKLLNEGFSTFAQDITILSCYENRLTKMMVFDESTKKWSRSGEPVMVLPQSSASQFLPKEKILSANADHSSIAKLRKNRDIYSSVKATIVQALVPTAAISREEHLGSVLPTPVTQGGRPSYVSGPHGHQSHPQEGDGYGHPTPHESDQYDPNMAGRKSVPPPMYAPYPGDPRIPFFAHSAAPTPYPPSSFQGPGQNHYVTGAGIGLDHGDPYASHPGFTPHNLPLPRPQLQRGPTSSSTSSGGRVSPMPIRLEGNYNLANMATNGGFARPTPQHNMPQRIPYGAGFPHTESTQQLHNAKMMQAFARMDLEPPHLNQFPAQSQEPELSHSPPREPSNVICDGCDTSIMGPFHHCKECPKWNFCPECFQLRLKIHPNHEFKTVLPGEAADDHLSSNSSESDETAEIGRAECSKCGMDIVSPDFFYMCSACSDDRVCQACQGDSASCLLHTTNLAQKRQFIFYGKEMDTDTWISPKPTAEDSAIVKALKERDMDLLDRFLRDQNRKRTLLSSSDADGRSLLHIVAHLDLDIEAKFLIMHGADLEAKDSDSCTPLGQALLSKNNEC